MTDSTTSGTSSSPRERRASDRGIRMIVTGQVGLDKGPFLAEVVDIAARHGHDVKLFNVGARMCAEAPDIEPKRILDLPRQRLTALRRSVFKDILVEAARGAHLIVNTHATFRWKHGLFLGFDHGQITALDADLYVTLVDNVDAIHERLVREHEIDHTLKDVLVWREEETVVTEAMAEAVAGYGRAYVVSRANPSVTSLSLYRLMFEPERKRIYPSFPMTHVMDQPAILRELEHFRDTLAEYFITFDPADVDEKRLLIDANAAMKRGEATLSVTVNDRAIECDVREITEVAGDIDGQIYARDFKLIDQSDMIVSYIPATPAGRPVLSSGVERELQHAFESTKEVYVIWRPAAEPSPFITETATAIFPSVEKLFERFQRVGYLGDYQLRLS